MARWQSSLIVSSLALRILFAWQCAVCGFLLYPIYQGNDISICLLLLLVSIECRLAANALRAQVGDIQIDERHDWRWRNKLWRLQGKPCLFSWGVLVQLSHQQQRTRLWLMQDKMSESEWRQLRRYLQWDYPKRIIE